MGTARKRPNDDGTKTLRPYYDVTPNEPIAREALNRLVGFDVAETEKRCWAWIKRRAPKERDGFVGVRQVSIPEPAEGEASDVTKARALAAEMTGTVMNTEHMYGRERIAAIRWYRALTSFAKAVDEFVPYARVREQEDSYAASKVSRGGRDGYDAIHALTRDIRDLVTALVAKVGEAPSRIVTFKDDPLPGLEPKKPHRGLLAGLCARLSLAGFTFHEIGDLVPDARRIDDERQERRYRARKKSGNAAGARARLEAHRKTYRDEHAERIRKLVAGVKPQIVQKRAAMARAEVALDAFMARTGKKARNMMGWLNEYLTSPEFLAIQADG